MKINLPLLSLMLVAAVAVGLVAGISFDNENDALPASPPIPVSTNVEQASSRAAAVAPDNDMQSARIDALQTALLRLSSAGGGFASSLSLSV